MHAKWLTVFHYTIYATCIVGLVMTVLSVLYFNSRTRSNPSTAAFSHKELPVVSPKAPF
jgi:hypothetical protein